MRTGAFDDLSSYRAKRGKPRKRGGLRSDRPLFLRFPFKTFVRGVVRSKRGSVCRGVGEGEREGRTGMRNVGTNN